MTTSSAAGVLPHRTPLRDPSVRRVLISNTVSGVGSSMTALALPWFVLITTGSATRMGLVYGAEVLPVAVLGIPSGLIVARLGVRRTLVSGDIILAVLMGLVPLLHLAGLLPFWLLLVIVAATGTVATPYFAAQLVVLPEVLGDDETTVTSANALIEGSTWGVMFAGPAIAGFLIAVVGPLNVIWIDAATFVFSGAFLLGLPKAKASLAASARRGGRILAGARYALKDPLLRRIMVAATCYGVLLPLLLMSLPLLARIRYDANPRVAGWLLAAWGGGALVGTFGVSPLVRRLRPLTVCAAGAVGLAVPLWFLPLRQPALAVAVIMAASGLFIPLINAPVYAVLTTRPPGHLRAQIMTLLVTASSLVRPASYAVGGTLFSRFGISHMQAAIAIGYTACAAIALALVRYQPAAAEPSAQ